MSDKHSDPLYRQSSAIVRAQVKRAWRFGEDVSCWRCGRLIAPASKFDTGHINRDEPATVENLLPEHMRCNRSDGGRIGARITNSIRGASTVSRPAPATPVVARRFAPW